MSPTEGLPGGLVECRAATNQESEEQEQPGRDPAEQGAGGGVLTETMSIRNWAVSITCRRSKLSASAPEMGENRSTYWQRRRCLDRRHHVLGSGKRRHQRAAPTTWISPRKFEAMLGNEIRAMCLVPRLVPALW